MMHTRPAAYTILLMLFALALPLPGTSPVQAAQQNPVPPAPPLQQDAPPRPRPDFTAVMTGAKLYRANCAQCHGPVGQGSPNWTQADKNGKYPPPPLNGTGHTWHHSTEVLVRTIRDGTAALGGNMPAWKDKLSDAQILAIIEWIKAQWPDNVYAAWREINEGK